jgi:hypothetical protein
MKSRDNEMNKAGSTHAAEPNVGSVGTGSASRRPASSQKAGQPSPDTWGRLFGQTSPLTHEQVAERARALWLASGCIPGRDEQNWREAEAQLKAELKSH